MIEIIEEKIQAIVPTYTEYGDITVVFTFPGNKKIFPVSMRTFLKKLFYFYTIDHLALKNKFRKIGIHQNAPILLKGEVFVKVKVRRPIGKSDGAYGYVNIKGIEKIYEEENLTKVLLKNGHVLNSLDSYATLSKNIMIGKSFDGFLEEKMSKKWDF